jgi:hypothetical protein
MGKPAVIDNAGIIDESFSGLANPVETIELGGDVAGERPGAILIDAVKQFDKDGGFRKIRDDRNADLAAAAAADTAERGSQTIEMDVSLPTAIGHPEKDRDIAED